MSEHFFFSLFMNDKTITNPINKSEVFMCSDLYKDFKLCKVLRKKGVRKGNDCKEIRRLGQKCYVMEEEEFERYLVKEFEEKIKYINYLKKEGSILYEIYKEDPTIFTVKKIQDDSQEAMMNMMNEEFTKR